MATLPIALLSVTKKAANRTLQIPGFLASGMIDLVLPPACRLCEGPLESPSADTADLEHADPKHAELFCGKCLSALSVSESMMRGACKKCGMPPPGILPPAADSLPTDPNLPDLPCPSCRGQDFDFDATFALWIYRGQVCDAIVASKYAHNAPLADALGHRLGRSIAAISIAATSIAATSDPATSDPANSDAEISDAATSDAEISDDLPSEVTFVPSHLFRQISRGGVGTRAIAGAVAQELKLPLRQRLKAVRPIAKQAWLDDDRRKQNVRGAFAVRKSYAFGKSPKLDNQHILVVDDVLTTGATAGEVARVLKDAGAAKVTIAVVSRAVRNR